MAVRGVDDVHVAPVEGPARGRELRLGVCAPLVNMRMTVAMFLAGACVGGERGERERKQRCQMHPKPGRKTVRGVGRVVVDDEARSA